MPVEEIIDVAADEPILSNLQYEVRSLQTSLTTLRSDLQVNLIEHAKLTQRMEQLGRTMQETEERLARAVEALESQAARSETALRKEIEKRVTVDRYSPVEKLVYGLIILILTAFVGALTSLVYLKGGPPHP